MSVSPVQDPPLVRAAAAIRAVLDRVVDAEASFLTPREKAAVLAEVATARAQLASVEAKVLAVGADVADLHATRDVAAWVAHETRQDVRAVRRYARLALTRSYPAGLRCDNDLELARDAMADWAVSASGWHSSLPGPA